MVAGKPLRFATEHSSSQEDRSEQSRNKAREDLIVRGGGVVGGPRRNPVRMTIQFDNGVTAGASATALEGKRAGYFDIRTDPAAPNGCGRANARKPTGGAMNLTDVSGQPGHTLQNLSFADGDVTGVASSDLDGGISTSTPYAGIVGQSAALREVLQLVELVAPSDSTVLLVGETGTGKELIAHAIHNRSRRAKQAFVKLNCAAIPAALLESELFGHERGAFTGAIAQKIGRVELADRGSLFLDETGDLPLELQPKLLRVLQDKEFERLGGTRTRRVDVRVVAATNRALEEMIVEKQFRLDLYYRLNVFPIVIPPLRERVEDIPLLANYFVRQFAHQMNKRIDEVSSETMIALALHNWPGNIRELQNVIERAVGLHERGNLNIKKSWLLGEPLQSRATGPVLLRRSPAEERERIKAALAETRGRVSGPFGAAVKLGIPPSTLESKIRAMNIDKYRFKISNASAWSDRIQTRFPQLSRIDRETQPSDK